MRGMIVQGVLFTFCKENVKVNQCKNFLLLGGNMGYGILMVWSWYLLLVCGILNWVFEIRGGWGDNKIFCYNSLLETCLTIMLILAELKCRLLCIYFGFLL